MIALFQSSALKKLAPRTLSRYVASNTPAADTRSGASVWTTSQRYYRGERGILRKPRDQAANTDSDTKPQTQELQGNERVRVAKVWAWTGALVAYFSLDKVENTCKNSDHEQSTPSLASNFRELRHDFRKLRHD